MYLLQDWRYGWQRFGENMDNTFLDPFIEGSWMTKHNGKYYFNMVRRELNSVVMQMV